MTPKRLGRPPAIDSAETRQRILAAARREFSRHGFDSTTNKDIAAEVGITTGAIYHYFDSKADLYVATFAEVQDRVYSRFAEAAVGHVGFAARLEAALDAAVALNEEDPSLAPFITNVASEAARHPELGELLAPLLASARSFFVDVVEEAAAAGELAADVPTQAVVDMINALLSGLARYAELYHDGQRHALATDALKRLIDGTLVKPAVPR